MQGDAEADWDEKPKLAIVSGNALSQLHQSLLWRVGAVWVSELQVSNHFRERTRVDHISTPNTL